MPKGARGSRGKSKGRPNGVIMGLKILKAPKGYTKADIRRDVLNSIENGDYLVPFQAVIRWSNDGGKTFREDEYTNAMIDSNTNGRGWNTLVTRLVNK